METIKIIQRINKKSDLWFCDYNPALDRAINNFKCARTVKVINNVCYIKPVSLGFFTELLSWDKVPYTVITTLN